MDKDRQWGRHIEDHTRKLSDLVQIAVLTADVPGAVEIGYTLHSNEQRFDPTEDAQKEGIHPSN